MNNPISDLLKIIYQETVSNSTKTLIYQADVLTKQVYHIMRDDQIKLVISKLEKVKSVCDKSVRKGEIDSHIANSMGSVIKFLNQIKRAYDIQGQNNPHQFKAYEIRNIMSKLNRSSRESESMRDRRYIYSVGNMVQKNINKFTDGELTRMNQLVSSEPNDVLSIETINRIKLISINASKRKEIDIEPGFWQWRRKAISKKHSNMVQNNPLPINY